MSSAALQATHHPPHASRAAAWHAVPTVKQRTVRRRRGAAHPAASAASLPADGSGSAPDEAVAAASWGGDTEVRAAAEVVPAAAGEGAPAAAAAEPQSSGLLGWLWERRRRTKSEWQRRVGSLGLSAVLAYGLLDCLTSAVAFLLCFLAYEARTVGQGPTWPAAQRSCPRFCCWSGPPSMRRGPSAGQPLRRWRPSQTDCWTRCSAGCACPAEARPLRCAWPAWRPAACRLWARCGCRAGCSL